jgi:hypothetical protein
VGRRSAKRRRRSFANTLRAKSGGKKGGSIGRIKHNQSALRQSIAAWIGAPTSRGAAGVQVANGHGRVAQRSLRRWSCGDVSRYLEERFAWPGAQWRGWIERKRWRKDQEHPSLHVGMAGAAFPGRWTPDAALIRFRKPWIIENGGFRVRDVTYDEDRLHGRKRGCGLSDIRNVAISLLRQPGYPYIPDAQRAIAAQPSLAFALLGIKD